VKSSWGIESQVVSHCLEKLADISWWTVLDFERTWSIVYLVYSVKLNHRLSLCMALCFLGDVCLFDRDEDTAHSLLTVALEGFTNMDVHRSRGRCMLRLGDLAQKWGDLPKAIELWKDAQPLFERSSQVKDVAEIQARLRDFEKD
jgi:hypothetical protein